MAAALAALAFGAHAHAQSGLIGPSDRPAAAGLGGILGFVGGAKAGAPADPVANPGFLGVTVEAAQEGRHRGVLVTAVAAGGAAEAAGLQVGDLLMTAFDSRGGRRSALTDPSALNTWLAGSPAGSKQWFDYRRAGKAGRAQVILAAAPPAPPKPPDPHAEARAAYAQLCSPGQERVSLATCQAMEADLNRAAADANRRQMAEAYAQFCSPGAETLGADTCAAMRADLNRGAAPKAAPPAARRKGTRR